MAEALESERVPGPAESFRSAPPGEVFRRVGALVEGGSDGRERQARASSPRAAPTIPGAAARGPRRARLRGPRPPRLFGRGLRSRRSPRPAPSAPAPPTPDPRLASAGVRPFPALRTSASSAGTGRKWLLASRGSGGSGAAWKAGCRRRERLLGTRVSRRRQRLAAELEAGRTPGGGGSPGQPGRRPGRGSW